MRPHLVLKGPAQSGKNCQCRAIISRLLVKSLHPPPQVRTTEWVCDSKWENEQMRRALGLVPIAGCR
jgi:hypothetical protein